MLSRLSFEHQILNIFNPNGIFVQLVPMHICNYRCIIQFEILERISCNFYLKEMLNELPSNATTEHYFVYDVPICCYDECQFTK